MHAEYCNYCSIAIFLASKTFWTSKKVTLSFNKRSLILLPRASKVVEYPMQWNTVDTEILNLIFPCPKPKDCPKFTIHNTHVWFLLAKCEQSYCNNTSAQQHYKSWHIDRKCKTWYCCTNLCIMPYHCVMYIQGGIRQRLFNAGQPVALAVAQLFWIHTLQVKPITLANCANKKPAKVSSKKHRQGARVVTALLSIAFRHSIKQDAWSRTSLSSIFQLDS